MSNCGACDLGVRHECRNVHPSTYLYGALPPAESAVWWRERANESAKEVNVLKDELRQLRRHRMVRFIERYRQ